MSPFFMRWEKASWPEVAEENTLYFHGLPGLPKKGLDQSWRWKWPRVPIRVSDPIPEEGYYVFFRTPSGFSMKTRWPVRTQMFAPRIGDGNVWFCAVNAKTGKPLSIVRVGIKGDYLTDV